MLSDDGAKVVKKIFEELDAGVRILPAEISLQHLEEVTGVRPQNIGMAFNEYIKPPLKSRGITAEKVGKPVFIKLMNA